MNSQQEIFAAAIDLLMDARTDFREICAKLAKHDTALFVRLAGHNDQVPWKLQVIDFLRDNRKVDAIKTIRANTGYCLKSAKDVAEWAQYEMSRQGLIHFSYEPPVSTLPYIERELLGQLIALMGD